MEPITPLDPPNRPTQVPPGPPNWSPQIPQAPQPPAPTAPLDIVAPLAPQLPQPSVTQPQPIPTQLGSQDAVPIGVSASSLGLNGKKHPALPIGVYVVAGLTLLNFLAAFFNTNTSPLYSIVMIFDLLVAIGLLSKLEIIRKVAFYVQMLSIVSICIVVGLLVSLQLKANEDYTKFHQAISQINTTTATPEQKTEIADLQVKAQQTHNQLGHTVVVADVRDGISLAVSIGIAFYLTRSGVKEAFHS
jgi:hypothetical protein